MINPADVFVMVKILEPNVEFINEIGTDEVNRVLSLNYYLSESHSIDNLLGHEEECDCDECDCDHDHDKVNEDLDKFTSMCTWHNADPSVIDQLPVGQCFKGITAESKMFTYQIIAKDNDGKSVWYPMSGQMDPVYVAWKFNPEEKGWEMLIIEPYDCLVDKLLPILEKNSIYKITDIANNTEAIFDNDDIDDDYDDDPRNGIYYAHEEDGEITLSPIKKLLSFIGIANDFVNDYKKFINVLKESITEEEESHKEPQQPEVDEYNMMREATPEEVAQLKAKLATVDEFDPSKEDF